MIQGLISDIHGNLAALKAVFADMEAQGAERIICLEMLSATVPTLESAWTL